MLESRPRPFSSKKSIPGPAIAVSYNQDLIWCVKNWVYMGFWVHRGSWLLITYAHPDSSCSITGVHCNQDLIQGYIWVFGCIVRPDDCARTPLRWKVKVTRINRLYDIPMICVYLEKREFWCSLWAATASGMVSLCVHFGFALRRFFFLFHAWYFLCACSLFEGVQNAACLESIYSLYGIPMIVSTPKSVSLVFLVGGYS